MDELQDIQAERAPPERVIAATILKLRKYQPPIRKVLRTVNDAHSAPPR